MGRTTLALGILLAWLARPAAAGDESTAARLEFFESKVRPVLAERCWGCHGPAKQKAGLRLDSRAAILRGGDSGPAVRPGDPEASRLIEVVRYEGETQMPPKGKLADPEIAALTDWVKWGAPWPEAGPEVRTAAPPSPKLSAADRAFWAFQPIRKPTPPPVRDAAWPQTPVDHFILAPLEAKGLRPVRPADKRALLRRVTFDLTGLPPTPEEVASFLADESPAAFARVVDRLLASPRYGERWGRHWLDVARYGEDQAHTFEARKYPYGYRYRDWVVQALNQDLPYDRFLLEQVAGDLLEGPGRDDRLAALGLFALGPVYYGRAIYDELDDRVDTLCRGVLGLTVACARCHDHKFDPIRQQDYYGLAGIFASSEYKEYPRAPADVVAAYDRAQAAIKAKTAEVAALLRDESARWTEAATGQTARYMVAAWTLVNRRKAKPDLPGDEVAKAEGLAPFVLDRWVKYLFPDKEDTRPYLARWRRVLAGQDRAKDLSGDEAAKAEVAKAAQAFQEYVQSLQAVRDAAKRRREAATALGIEDDGKPPIGDLETRLLREVVSTTDGLFALPRRDGEKWLSTAAKAALKARRAELARLQKEAPPKYPVVHSLTDASSPADMKVFLRGNPATPGEVAPRRFLAVLSAEGSTPFRRGSGRLELARALASPENPLTARVIVNRLWAHHFGRGLVATPSNFGHMGERPSHPEPLDYLATRLIAAGWSLKALHREILLSATYQLAADDDPPNHEVDPENILCWRANRRRLEVEAWRDAMLAVSGELEGSLGGPSSDLAAPDNRRRTLYAAISRHNLDGLLRLFDFPDPNLTSDKRPVTTVPLQQLFVLNSEFMGRRAKALAARLTADPAPSDADRIRRAFLRLFGREATEREVQIGLDFLAGDGPSGEDRGTPTKWEQYAQVLLGTNEFLYLD